MCPANKRTPGQSGRGFTLLEIMLAVAVMGLVTISIYRFVESTLSAIRVSTEQFRESALITSFAGFMRAQMNDLPIRLGAISGEPHRFNNVACDELRWISGPGSGLLTRFATGEYTATLTTQQLKEGGFELGLRRQDIDAREEATWLPLLSGVNAFEVRYFDARSQEWMEKWTDLAIRPTLVRVRLWRKQSTDPYEMVLPIPYTSANAQTANFNFSGNRRRNRRNRPPEAGENGGDRRRGGERGSGRNWRNGPSSRPTDGERSGQRPPPGGSPR